MLAGKPLNETGRDDDWDFSDLTLVDLDDYLDQVHLPALTLTPGASCNDQVVLKRISRLVRKCLRTDAGSAEVSGKILLTILRALVLENDPVEYSRTLKPFVVWLQQDLFEVIEKEQTKGEWLEDLLLTSVSLRFILDKTRVDDLLSHLCVWDASVGDWAKESATIEAFLEGSLKRNIREWLKPKRAFAFLASVKHTLVPPYDDHSPFFKRLSRFIIKSSLRRLPVEPVWLRVDPAFYRDLDRMFDLCSFEVHWMHNKLQRYIADKKQSRETRFQAAWFMTMLRSENIIELTVEDLNFDSEEKWLRQREISVFLFYRYLPVALQTLRWFRLRPFKWERSGLWQPGVIGVEALDSLVRMFPKLRKQHVTFLRSSGFFSLLGDWLKSPLTEADDRQRVAACVVFWLLFGVEDHSATVIVQDSVSKILNKAVRVTGWTTVLIRVGLCEVFSGCRLQLPLTNVPSQLSNATFHLGGLQAGVAEEEEEDRVIVELVNDIFNEASKVCECVEELHAVNYSILRFFSKVNRGSKGYRRQPLVLRKLFAAFNNGQRDLQENFIEKFDQEDLRELPLMLSLWPPYLGEPGRSSSTDHLYQFETKIAASILTKPLDFYFAILFLENVDRPFESGLPIFRKCLQKDPKRLLDKKKRSPVLLRYALIEAAGMLEQPRTEFQRLMTAIECWASKTVWLKDSDADQTSLKCATKICRYLDTSVNSGIVAARNLAQLVMFNSLLWRQSPHFPVVTEGLKAEALFVPLYLGVCGGNEDAAFIACMAGFSSEATVLDVVLQFHRRLGNSTSAEVLAPVLALLLRLDSSSPSSSLSLFSRLRGICRDNGVDLDDLMKNVRKVWKNEFLEKNPSWMVTWLKTVDAGLVNGFVLTKLLAETIIAPSPAQLSSTERLLLPAFGSLMFSSGAAKVFSHDDLEDDRRAVATRLGYVDEFVPSALIVLCSMSMIPRLHTNDKSGTPPLDIVRIVGDFLRIHQS